MVSRSLSQTLLQDVAVSLIASFLACIASLTCFVVQHVHRYFAILYQRWKLMLSKSLTRKTQVCISTTQNFPGYKTNVMCWWLSHVNLSLKKVHAKFFTRCVFIAVFQLQISERHETLTSFLIVSVGKISAWSNFLKNINHFLALKSQWPCPFTISNLYSDYKANSGKTTGSLTWANQHTTVIAMTLTT